MTAPSPISEFVAATIDIESPIRLVSGQWVSARFTYTLGNPPADRFEEIMFYRSLSDRDEQINQLETGIIEYTIMPVIPSSNTDQLSHVGQASFRLSPGFNVTEVYSEILICQPPLPDEIPDCDNKEIPTPTSRTKNRAVRDKDWLRQSPVPIGICSTSAQDLVLNCDVFRYAQGDTIDIDMQSLTNGCINVLEKPDFLREDGTHLKGIMPEGEIDEYIRVKIESQNVSIVTNSIFLRRVNI